MQNDSKTQRSKEARTANRRLAQWRVKWLIEYSASHQLLWCIDSFVLLNPPLRQAPKRYVTFYHTVMKQKSELIESLLNEAQKLSYKDGNLDKVQKRAEMLVKKVFGEKTEYVQKLNSISYSPYVVTSGMDRSVYQRSFSSGKDELINLINTMLEDLSLTDLL